MTSYCIPRTVLTSRVIISPWKSRKTVHSGPSVTVNGIAVKVYKTGTFATTVDLSLGANDICVEAVTSDGASATRTQQCFRAEKSQAEFRSATEDEAPVMMFASPRRVVTLEDAFLQYGSGDDRLGGSKMGFIDP